MKPASEAKLGIFRALLPRPPLIYMYEMTGSDGGGMQDDGWMPASLATRVRAVGKSSDPQLMKNMPSGLEDRMCNTRDLKTIEHGS